MEKKLFMKVLTCPIDNIKNFNQDELCRIISSERLIKAGNYKFEKDKMLSLSASFLFYKAFCDYKADKNATIPDFSYGEHKKPYLDEFPDFKFNLSHSGSLSSIIYGDKECGIDVQLHSNMSDSLINRFINKQDYFAIDLSGEELLFFSNMAWAVKEAYIKFLGLGLSYDMRNCRIELNDEELLKFKKIYSEKNNSEYISNTFILGRIIDENNEYPIGYFKYFVIKYYEIHHLAMCSASDSIANCSHFFINSSKSLGHEG